MAEIGVGFALLVVVTGVSYYYCLRFGALQLGYGRDWRTAKLDHPEKIIELGWSKIGTGLRLLPLVTFGLFIGSIIRAVTGR